MAETGIIPGQFSANLCMLPVYSLRRRRVIPVAVGLLAVAMSSPAVADTVAERAKASLQPDTTVDQCVRDRVAGAAPDATVADLRAACAALLQVDEPQAGADADASAFKRRGALEKSSEFNPFAVTSNRPNYLLPLSYHDSPNLASTNGNGLEERTEAKFQLSFKFPAWIDMFGTTGDLYLAYTGQFYWQAFDVDQSRPFRESNHEPELFVDFDADWNLFGVQFLGTIDTVRIGLVHQSNGQDLPQSRSWNRVYAQFFWEYEDLLISFKPWVRIPDPDKESPDDPRGDDNPNIERFVGQMKTVVAWRNGNDTYSAVWRNNLRADNRGSLELGWSFPLTGRLRGYVQAFTGYGESLIDYDDAHNRIGVGLLLTDWL